MKTMLKKIRSFFNRSIDNKLTYSEVKNIMMTNTDTVLIDVRSNQEYREGHLANSINLPVYDLASKIKYNIQDRNNIIILYCQTEIRSKKAKKILEKIGYSNIYILEGGIDGIL